VLPPEIANHLPKNRLLEEVRPGDQGCEQRSAAGARLTPRPFLLSPQNEWRALGVQQSRGWVHYAVHRPEPHIMLFRCTRALARSPRAAGRTAGAGQLRAAAGVV
jgi:hypothetical protein